MSRVKSFFEHNPVLVHQGGRSVSRPHRALLTDLSEYCHSIVDAFNNTFGKTIVMFNSDDAALYDSDRLLTEAVGKIGRTPASYRKDWNQQATYATTQTMMYVTSDVNHGIVYYTTLHIPDQILGLSMFFPKFGLLDYDESPLDEEAAREYFNGELPYLNFAEGQFKRFILFHELFHGVDRTFLHRQFKYKGDEGGHKTELFADLGACLLLYREGHHDMYRKIADFRDAKLVFDARSADRMIYANGGIIRKVFKKLLKEKGHDALTKLSLKEIRELAEEMTERYGHPHERLERIKSRLRRLSPEDIKKRVFAILHHYPKTRGFFSAKRFNERYKPPQTRKSLIEGMNRLFAETEGKHLSPEKAELVRQGRIRLNQQLEEHRRQLKAA